MSRFLQFDIQRGFCSSVPHAGGVGFVPVEVGFVPLYHCGGREIPQHEMILVLQIHFCSIWICSTKGSEKYSQKRLYYGHSIFWAFEQVYRLTQSILGDLRHLYKEQIGVFGAGRDQDCNGQAQQVQQVTTRTSQPNVKRIPVERCLSSSITNRFQGLS